MPWELEERDGRWCVVKLADGEVEGCHDSRGQALAHQRALYTSESPLYASLAASVAPEVSAAGVALVAADTGRVLMIQRALIDGEPAGGKWEFPGGRLNEGEDAVVAAQREFAEETGHQVPEVEVVSTWLSPNGVYQGFVAVTSSEDAFPLGETDPESREVQDPDNPDGSNYTESLAWFDPFDLDRGPKILREECRATPWALLKQAGAPGREGALVAAAAEIEGLVVPKLDDGAVDAAVRRGLARLEQAAVDEFQSLVASIGPAAADDLLPADELPGPTPWTVSADGRTADGHLALWASCHTGFPKCVKPPREDSFDFFNLGDYLAADGRRVPVGKVTVGTGHAGPDLTWRTAAVHYDNSGAAVAVAHAVPDRWGIRLPSVILASATPEQVEEVRRSPLSGDWRRVNGRLRLVAALGVNVPGYPVPRALVASGEVQSMFAGFDPADAVVAQAEADEMAEALGLGVRSRVEAIRAGLLD